MKHAGNVIHRCEAGPEIGAGHFFRQLALAEAGRARGRDPLLLVGGLTPALEDQAKASGIAVEVVEADVGGADDARAVTRRAAERESRSVVVDGYRFGPDYYRRLGDAFDVVAAVDDVGAQAFPVDVLINVNPHASDLDYEGPARCLVGPRYALLRRQFLEARRTLEEARGPAVPEEVSRVLVAYGGADIGNMSSRALEALNAADYRGEVDLVLGPATPDPDGLVEMAKECRAEIRVHRNVTRMAELLSGQHLALCAAGTMSWELACLGVPMIQTVVADNQREIAAALDDAGVAIQAGSSDAVQSRDLADLFVRVAADAWLRARVSRGGMRLVDGRGGDRVLEVLAREEARGRRRPERGRTGQP